MDFESLAANLLAVPKYFFVIIVAYLIICYIIHIILYCTYYSTTVYSSNQQLKEILSKFKYVPTFYLPLTIFQIVFFVLMPCPDLKFKREYYTLKDKTTISFDWCLHHIQKPLLVICHGMTGGTETAYMKSLLSALYSSFNLVTIHFKGINDTPLTVNYSFHCASTQDTKEALDIIRSSTGVKAFYKTSEEFNSFFLIGISMGANLLVNVFESNPSYYNSFIKAFISVSNPLFLKDLVDKNKGNIADKFILKRCQSIILKNDILKTNTNFDFNDVKKTKSCNEFNTKIAMRMEHNKFNFKSLDDYYFRTSSGYHVSKVKVPSLFLISEMDSLNSIGDLNLEVISAESKHLNFIVTSHGGHVTWSEGIFPKRVSNQYNIQLNLVV